MRVVWCVQSGPAVFGSCGVWELGVCEMRCVVGNAQYGNTGMWIVGCGGLVGVVWVLCRVVSVRVGVDGWSFGVGEGGGCCGEMVGGSVVVGGCCVCVGGEGWNVYGVLWLRQWSVVE